VSFLSPVRGMLMLIYYRWHVESIDFFGLSLSYSRNSPASFSRQYPKIEDTLRGYVDLCKENSTGNLAWRHVVFAVISNHSLPQGINKRLGFRTSRYGLVGSLEEEGGISITLWTSSVSNDERLDNGTTSHRSRNKTRSSDISRRQMLLESPECSHAARPYHWSFRWAAMRRFSLGCIFPYAPNSEH